MAGGCRHKVFGTRGVFKDAKGLIKFLDVIAGVTGDPVTGEYQAGSGANNFLYYGRIRFGHDDRGTRDRAAASVASSAVGASSLTSTPLRRGGC